MFRLLPVISSTTSSSPSLSLLGDSISSVAISFRVFLSPTTSIRRTTNLLSSSPSSSFASCSSFSLSLTTLLLRNGSQKGRTLLSSQELQGFGLVSFRKQDKELKGGKGNKKQQAAKEEEDGEEGAEEGGTQNEGQQQLDINKYESKLKDILEWMQKQLSTLRIGRANPSLLEGVIVEVQGERRNLIQLSQVSVKDPQTLLVNVYDPQLVKAVDSALREADLGLNPQAAGNLITVRLPKVTKEFRDSMVKVATKHGEQAKLKIRGLRKDAMDDLRSTAKSMPKDDARRLEQQLQTLTDAYTKRVGVLLDTKEREIQG